MDRGDRDIQDLDNPNLVVYNVRGYTVFAYNKEHKRLYIGRNATYVLPCDEDLELMAKFLLDVKKYQDGKVDHIANVELN
jgi:hypothetical protein